MGGIQYKLLKRYHRPGLYHDRKNLAAVISVRNAFLFKNEIFFNEKCLRHNGLYYIVT